MIKGLITNQRNAGAPVPAELYAGLMTGTSMDGIDAVLVAFSNDQPRLISTHSIEHDSELRRRLLRVNGSTALAEVMDLDARLGETFADVTLALLDHAGVSVAEVAGVGSHGQTLWHAPDDALPSTLQVGDPHRVAQRTGITVVADFRRRDMAAGGQGAPLAPLFHKAFFHSPAEDRVVVNIGGMANLTRLPRSGDPATITGFDTGPGNIFLDTWYARHKGGAFDPGGAWGATARVDDVLLGQLRDDAYFHRAPPKSTGRDHFNDAWLMKANPERLPPETVQSTLAQLTADTIADGIRSSMPGAARVLVCGGGARNDDLMARLAAALPHMCVEDTGQAGVDAGWVEAIGFAWLARETLAGRPGNLPSVTGASSRVPLGAVHPGSPQTGA